MRVTAALLVGLILGLSIETAWASRDSSGNYTLPTGTAPVAAGQTVTAARHNALANDVATELTDSLSRTGKGGMSAPLVCSVGSVSAPSLTFSGDTDIGLYRETTNTPAMSAAGTKAMSWSSTTGATGFGRGAAGVGITGMGSQAGQGGTFTSDGGDALSAQATAPNRVGATLTGGPGGYGVYALGAPDGGYGAFAAGVGGFQGLVVQGGAGAAGAALTGGAGNTAGATSTASGSGDGLQGVATSGAGVWGAAAGGYGVKGTATTGYGLYGYTSGAGAGHAVRGEATGTTGAGGYFTSVSGRAVEVGNGDLKFTAAPSVSGGANILTGKNFTKVWATVNTNGASEASASDSYGIAGVSDTTQVVRVTFATAFANANYAVSALADGTLSGAYVPVVVTRDTGYVELAWFDVLTDPSALVNPDFLTMQFSVTVTGAQ